MKRRIQIKDLNQWNELMDRVEQYTTVLEMLKEEDDNPHHSLADFSYYKESPKYVTLTTRWGFNNKPTTFIFTTNGDDIHLRQGSEEYGIQKRAFKEYLPDLSDDPILLKRVGKVNGKFLNKIAGIQKFNPKYNHKKTYCYQYDLNSAYLAQMYYKIPDTRAVKDYDREIKEGEIGFIFDDELTLIDKPGLFAEIIFDLIDSPEDVKKYCERWFQRKKDKVNGAKHQIVDAIGYMQYKNPYMRSYIIHKCNYYIQSLLREDTILCNTDAIYSEVPRDLEIGTGLGQWKYSEGFITLNDLNYKSDEFGDVERGILKNVVYKVENRRIIRL